MARAASSPRPPASSARRYASGGGQHVGKLLRLRASGVVNEPSVRLRERPAEALRSQLADHRVEGRNKPVPGQWTAAARRRSTDGVEAEADARGGRSNAALPHQARQQMAGIVTLRAEVEVEHNICVQVNAVERARNRSLGCIETIAVSADRAGEDKRKASGAVLELVQRLGICQRRVGMIDALHDLPGKTRRATGKRLGILPSHVQRLDGQPVIGMGDQRAVVRPLLEHGFDQLAPLFSGRWRELGSQRQIVIHGHKMPRVRHGGQCARPRQNKYSACRGQL